MTIIKGFGLSNTLLENYLKQVEMIERATRIPGVDVLQQYRKIGSEFQEVIESPLPEWIKQKKAWDVVLGTNFKNMGLSLGWDYSKMASVVGEMFGYQSFDIKQYNNLCRSIAAFSHEQFDYEKMLDVAYQISPILKDLNITGIASNMETIYDQLSSWSISEDEIDYDDISVNDDGSLCYKDQCVTQPEINDIWNTFVQNCDNLGSKASEAIKDKIWVVQWIYRFIFILITELGLFKDIEEHIHKGLLEARSRTNGWDKMFAIKNDNGARVYSEPNTKSMILGKLDYECVITILEKQTYWVKFEYKIAEGQTVEAWIATCNLIRYDKLQNNHMALLEEEDICK